MVPSSQAFNPISPRLIRFHHSTLDTRSNESRRRVVARKRQSNSARRAPGRADLEMEHRPVRRPLGREPAQRGRKADIDILQIADLWHDCPSSTCFTEKLYAANIGLHDPSAPRQMAAYHDEETLALTIKELVGPVAHPCACEIRGSFVYGA